MASTILNEQGWDPELIEVALPTSIKMRCAVLITEQSTSTADAQ